MLDAELVLGAGRSHHEEGRLGDGPRMNPIPMTVPAAVPSGTRPLPPEAPTWGEPAGDRVEHRDGGVGVGPDIAGAAVGQERMRGGGPADPADVHRLAIAGDGRSLIRQAVERGGFDQHARIMAEVPAMQTVRRQRGPIVDRHPGVDWMAFAIPLVERSQHGVVRMRIRWQHEEKEAEHRDFAGLPVMRQDLGRRGRILPDVGDRLFTGGKVEEQAAVPAGAEAEPAEPDR